MDLYSFAWPATASPLGRGALAASVALSLAAAPAQAQWVLDASAGRLSYGLAPAQVESLGTSLGLRYDGTRWLYLSGGLPFDTAGVPWGALGAGARLVSRGWHGVGIDGAGHVFGYGDPAAQATGAGVILGALPLAYATAGGVRVEVRSGLLHYSRTHAGEAVSRSVHHSDARVRLPAGSLTLSAESRYVRAAEGGYPFVGAAAETSAGRATLWGSAGRWLSSAIETPVWSAGARLRTAGRTEVFASVQQEANDPLFWNAPRQTWSAGLSLRFGGAPRPPSAPARPSVASGRVTFRLPLSTSSAPPAVAGDFNGWKPVAMTRSGEHWIASLPIAPGVYRYGYRRGDGKWFVPEWVAGRVSDGLGGTSAVLVVPR